MEPYYKVLLCDFCAIIITIFTTGKREIILIIEFKSLNKVDERKSTLKFYKFFQKDLHCYLLSLQSCIFAYINNHLKNVVCI